MKFSKPWCRTSRRAWFVTLDGRQLKLGKTKQEALARYHEMMAAPKKRTVNSDSLLGIIDAFLEWVEQNRSPDTYEWYRYRLQRFAVRCPDLRVMELHPYHVETWASEYQFSVTSRRNYLRSVKRCLKWAKKQGYIDRNPIEELEVPSAEHREVAISQAEFDGLLSCVRNQALADLILVTWETGCRPQESLRVEARHVDLRHHRWVFQKSESKTKQITRVVYLTDTALAITQRLMLAYPDGRLFRNSSGRPWTTDAVNCGFDAIQRRMGIAEMQRRREAISAEVISQLVPTLSSTKSIQGQVVSKSAAELSCEAKRKLTSQRAAALAPRYSLYALRHSWATNALKKGIDPLTVAILMGHKDPSMLSRVYQHLSLNPQHMLEQAKKAAG